MNQKVFDNIKAYLKPSAELIRRTKEEIRDDRSKVIRRHNLYKHAAITASFAFIAISVLLYLHFNTSNGNMLNNKEPLLSSWPVSSTTKDPALMNFSVSAYSPKTANQVLTPNYLEETVQTRLKPNIKALMANYSPLTSSVPGYPFKFEVAQFDNNNIGQYLIRVTADHGKLLGLKKETGKVIDYGDERDVLPNETLFWSPLEDSKAATDAKIVISIIKDKKKIGEQTMRVFEEDNMYYAVTDEIRV